jgi:zinc and cadmium transporter
VTLFGHVLTAGLVMTVIALSGALTLLLSAKTVERLITPLVAFAAGTLLSGALLHLQPAALTAGLEPLGVGLYTLAGFVLFLLLERVIQRHRHHRAAGGPRPLTYLILLGDGVHNFLGGLAIGAAFITDVRLGWTAWLAAATHEVPQELGDFGVLIHGGWPRRRALFLNFLSGLTFLVGALIAYAIPAAWGVLALGWLAASLFALITTRPWFWMGALFLFVIITFHLYGAVLAVLAPVQGCFSLYYVLGATTIAALAMLGYLLREHRGTLAMVSRSENQ